MLLTEWVLGGEKWRMLCSTSTAAERETAARSTHLGGCLPVQCCWHWGQGMYIRISMSSDFVSASQYFFGTHCFSNQKSLLSVWCEYLRVFINKSTSWENLAFSPLNMVALTHRCWTLAKDISCAGEMQGLNGERSSLIRETFRVWDTLDEKSDAHDVSRSVTYSNSSSWWLQGWYFSWRTCGIYSAPRKRSGSWCCSCFRMILTVCEFLLDVDFFYHMLNGSLSCFQPFLASFDTFLCLVDDAWANMQECEKRALQVQWATTRLCNVGLPVLASGSVHLHSFVHPWTHGCFENCWCQSFRRGGLESSFSAPPATCNSSRTCGKIFEFKLCSSFIFRHVVSYVSLVTFHWQHFRTLNWSRWQLT